MTITVRIKQLGSASGLPLPGYATEGSSGLDLVAAVNDPLTIMPASFHCVPTGLSIEVPSGYEAQIRPRSGLSSQHGITVLNTPGTIDSDYRGEIGVILINLGQKPFTINRGDRIAQMVFAKVEHPRIVPADELDTTPRGEGGFGHTGR